MQNDIKPPQQNFSENPDSLAGRSTLSANEALELLKKLRLVDELDLMHLNGEKHFYEAKTTVEHIHLACFQCGGIQEFTTPLLEKIKAEIAQQTGFRVRVIRLEAGGGCKNCCAGAGCEGCSEPECSKKKLRTGTVRLTLAKRTARSQ